MMEFPILSTERIVHVATILHGSIVGKAVAIRHFHDLAGEPKEKEADSRA